MSRGDAMVGELLLIAILTVVLTWLGVHSGDARHAGSVIESPASRDRPSDEDESRPIA